MSENGSKSKTKTIEEMEKEMAKHMMDDNPEEARLIMGVSSHSGLNLPPNADGPEANKAISGNSSIKDAVAPEQQPQEDPPVVEELYRKDNAILEGSSSEEKPIEESPVQEALSEQPGAEKNPSAEIPKDKSSIVQDSAEIPKDKSSIVQDSAEIAKEKSSIVQDSAEIAKEKSSIVQDSAKIPKEKSSVVQNSAEIAKEKSSVDQDSAADDGNSAKNELATADDNVNQKTPSANKSALKEPKSEDGNNKASKPRVSFLNSQEIYSLPNAQLFSINPADNTAKSMESGELRIVEIPGRIPEDATKDSFSQSSPPPAFLQIGNWLYPLIPYNSPIYRSDEGHYIFPDLKADKAGAAAGLVLPANTLLMDIDEFESILKAFTKLEEFTFAPPMMFGNTSALIDQARRAEEDLLDQVVSDIINNEASKSKAAIISKQEMLKSREAFKSKEIPKSKDTVPVTTNKDEEKIKDNNNSSAGKTQQQQSAKQSDVFNCGRDNQRFGGFGFVSHRRNEQQRENHTAQYLSTKIADGIIAGAEVITRGVTYGASKTSEILYQGSGLLKSYSEGPTTSPAKIPRRLHGGVKRVKNYTGKFVELSSYVVDELGNATSALAEFLSPYLHQTTTTLVTKATGSNETESNYIVGNVLELTSGTLQGMHMVYSGLHEAARILARSITNNTVDVVTHYYGPKAGEIIDDAAETVGNIALGGANAQSLNPKAVVKRAAKDTGIVLLTKEETNNS